MHLLSLIVTLLFIYISTFSQAIVDLQARDFYVHDLPLLPTNLSSIRMHAGHVPVSSIHHGTLFFWHFAQKNVTDKSRTVIWLNGGPGCSSMMGIWLIIGPFRFQDENTIVENNGSWHLHANLLFVDQPLGTGFSKTYSRLFVRELDEMADHFLGFLNRYIEIFPELLEDDIYLAGESFAGQYIPYIARTILDKRSDMKLRGLLIGNGFTDPISKYKSLLPFAVENNLVEENSKLFYRIAHQTKLCEQALHDYSQIFYHTCYRILYDIVENGSMNNHHGANEKGRCVNMYDIRLDDIPPACGTNWPAEMIYVKQYLQRKDVMSRIHVDDWTVRWVPCAEIVRFKFTAIHSKPSITLLPDLLRQIPILLYSGEYDLISNHMGTELMIDTMTWNNRTGFDLGNGILAPTESWIIDGESAGLIRRARNLTYILFYNGSHMVPYDQPRRSQIMLHQFIQSNFTSLISNTIKKRRKLLFKRTRSTFNSIIGIVVAAIISIIALIWFLIWKQYPTRIATPCSIIRMIRSKLCHVQEGEMGPAATSNNSSEESRNLNDETIV
ncbi:unnamed protein product [Adineta ricciae]|uniref:Pheromone-processing carboxypeptidase KEX1 n=1 Tax=Adineta ricciae TaxID=249248 RepID=A0A814VEK8_ADIRI|nr:unnamed protein product [Adineta ricciae]CAF1503954.1 unnamed protein product [Adineta ricciae]